MGNTAVGHDFDTSFGHQHVEQHPGVVLGIPHVQLGENLPRTSDCVDTFQHQPWGQS